MLQGYKHYSCKGRCVCVCMHVCLHVCLCLSIFTENSGAEDEQFLRSGYTQTSSTQEDLLGGIGSGNRKEIHERLMKKVSERS
jgi:hypothetical protein